MQLPLVVSLVDRASGTRVRGRIQTAVEQHLLWWTGWRYDDADEDRGWDWWGIHRECSSSAGRYECYAAVAANDLQGLMVLDLRGRRTGAGKAIVVDYLATNPANRAATRGLKYVGIALMAVAIRRSTESGADGRVWLESLPGAAGFYESMGMKRQPLRSAEGNLVYILEPEVAEQLLEKIKQSRIVEP
jgi:hypothetical protein